MERIHALILDESAASSMEYCLLVTGIAIVVLAPITGIGRIVLNNFYGQFKALFH